MLLRKSLIFRRSLEFLDEAYKQVPGSTGFVLLQWFCHPLRTCRICLVQGVPASCTDSGAPVRKGTRGGEGGGGGNAVEAEPALQGWLEPKALPEVLQHHLGDSDSLLQDARLCPAIEHTSSMRLHHSN